MATYRVQRKLFNDFCQDPYQSSFSTYSLDENLKDASLIGGGLVTAGGGLYLAKKGKLGFTRAQKVMAKRKYNLISSKIKTILKEEKPKGFKPEEPKIKPEETKIIKPEEPKYISTINTTTKSRTRTTKPKKTTTKKPETSKTGVTAKPYYKPEDWKKIVNYSKKNKCSTGEAASKLGIKPVPPKPPKR